VEASRNRVRLALTVGEQGPALTRLLAAARIPAESVGTVSAAVARAARTARAGETVLLSPGFSSHDQFTHYRQRGEAFVREVRRAMVSGQLADEAQES
jgi:UDP-N-acetylmuramoylalanine--D-glutamate ligase